MVGKQFDNHKPIFQTFKERKKLFGPQSSINKERGRERERQLNEQTTAIFPFWLFFEFLKIPLINLFPDKLKKLVLLYHFPHKKSLHVPACSILIDVPLVESEITA